MQTFICFTYHVKQWKLVFDSKSKFQVVSLISLSFELLLGIQFCSWILEKSGRSQGFDTSTWGLLNTLVCFGYSSLCKKIKLNWLLLTKAKLLLHLLGLPSCMDLAFDEGVDKWITDFIQVQYLDQLENKWHWLWWWVSAWHKYWAPALCLECLFQVVNVPAGK